MMPSQRRGPQRTNGGFMYKSIFGLLVMVFLLVPHGAKAWWNDDWSFRKKITLEAGAKGAALPQDAGRVPVLVRLSDGNFKFSDAADDGSDIRFVDGDDKTPLKYHIESWDGALGIAMVWVDIPAVRAGATADIYLYYGNSKAKTGADPHATYDNDTVLVYHFAERNAAPKDMTAAGNNPSVPAGKSVDALIGSGLAFDGTSGLVVPASPSLTFSQGASLTWSAWVKFDAPQSNAVIFAKHDGPRSLIVALDQNAPLVTIADDTSSVHTDPGTPLAPGWHLIAVTASDHVTVFVDGQQRTTLAAALPALAGPASIGADVDASGQVVGTGFSGQIDEVEISKTARGPGFLAAAFASQGTDEKLVTYGQDEQNAQWSSGYFGVILKSVTIDGWVVIGILGVMMVISVLTMVTKSMYVNRLAKANDRFITAFTKAGSNFEKFEARAREGDAKAVHASALYRIYRAGAEELTRRFEGTDDLPASRNLTPQAIATIRASLDRVASREGQRLNSMMVLLTIAISGGPFLGLLGTVVGVMITFAAIAASGDVNVNAIAPGIAAALVATVAGLAVAIPALFGYNYLTVRIKDLTTDMHVFVDEFTTRIAETYVGGSASSKLAAE